MRVLKKFGWLNKPLERQRIQELRGRYATFKAAAHHWKGTGDKVDVYQSEDVEEKVLGKRLPTRKQTLGTCVGYGWAEAVKMLKLTQILRGEGRWVADISPLFIYAVSRTKPGGGRLGSQEGSLGEWAAVAVQKYGILLMKKYGQYDLSTMTDQYAHRNWSIREPGTPEELDRIAKEHPVKDTAKLDDFGDARDAFANGCAVTFCGMLGFSMRRDGPTGTGICRQTDRWPHCQMATGAVTLKWQKMPCLIIKNSWADYLGDAGNRVTLESGREIVLGGGEYCVPADVCDRQFRAGDCHALTDFVGFKRERPNFDPFSWSPW